MRRYVTRNRVINRRWKKAPSIVGGPWLNDRLLPARFLYQQLFLQLSFCCSVQRSQSPRSGMLWVWTDSGSVLLCRRLVILPHPTINFPVSISLFLDPPNQDLLSKKTIYLIHACYTPGESTCGWSLNSNCAFKRYKGYPPSHSTNFCSWDERLHSSHVSSLEGSLSYMCKKSASQSEIGALIFFRCGYNVA